LNENLLTKYHKPFYHFTSKGSGFGPYRLSSSGPDQIRGQVFHLAVMVETLWG